LSLILGAGHPSTFDKKIIAPDCRGWIGIPVKMSSPQHYSASTPHLYKKAIKKVDGLGF
jgi:hypothetical protein